LLAGEIEDPFADEARPPELVELQKRFDALTEEQRELMVKDEYDRIYTAAGASGINAFTNEDVTVYFLTVPANKLELWFWMESDRLLSPVFREFYSERDVVHEERRLRTESTPTGEFDEVFDAMFWQSHSYSWPVGWRWISGRKLASASTSRLTARETSPRWWRPSEEARSRRVTSAPFVRAAPDVVTLEMEPRAEKRMVAECDCQPQVEIRYHSVPFRHRDSYALEVLAGLLNGRSGRLYKSLVLERGLAADASASQDSRRYAGAFSLYAQAKGGASPSDLERALLEEVRRIASHSLVSPERNQIRGLHLSGGFTMPSSFYDGLGTGSI
jgi:predicted Zn-dependent peptidase